MSRWLCEGTGDRIVNQPEADAVVDQIAKCLADPAYDGKSFGVICLQGNAQANLIRDLLMDRIGAQKMQNRGLYVATRTHFRAMSATSFFSHWWRLPTMGVV